MFDPYHKWLGIPKDRRPPTHFDLLGIAADEDDTDVIDAAALRQIAFVRNYQAGQYARDCAKVLNELAQARLTLMDAEKRGRYREAVGAARTAATTAPVPAASTPAGSTAATLTLPLTLDEPDSLRDDRPRRRQGPIAVGVLATLGLLAAAGAFWKSRKPEQPPSMLAAAVPEADGAKSPGDAAEAPPTPVEPEPPAIAEHGPDLPTATAAVEPTPAPAVTQAEPPKPAATSAAAVPARPATFDVAYEPAGITLKLFALVPGQKVEVVRDEPGRRIARIPEATADSAVRVQALKDGYKPFRSEPIPLSPGKTLFLRLTLTTEDSPKENAIALLDELEATADRKVERAATSPAAPASLATTALAVEAIRSVDLERGRTTLTPRCLAASGDGRNALVGGEDGRLYLFVAASGVAKSAVLVQPGGVTALACSADGLTAATGGADGTVRTCPTRSFKPTAPILLASGPINRLALSRDGKLLAAAAGEILAIVGLEGDRRARPVEGEGKVDAIAFSPDAGRLWAARGGAARLYAVDKAAIRALAVPAPIAGLADLVTALALSPDGREVCLGYASGRLRTWDADDGRLLREFGSAPRPIASIAYAADGKKLVEFDGGGMTARVWDPTTGDPVARLLGHNRDVLGAAFLTPKGGEVAAIGQDRTLRLWDIDKSPAEAAKTGRGRVPTQRALPAAPTSRPR